ncbi:zinc finger protein 568-like isoform X2 [Dicentrarchus labrax]|uniref:zinc finger protein 568-like isoform X2 n=1 Tax=Dicentrarchus labrax TaxID=13489 RepID=UPI0021F55CC4|nr:zinc finger protein 568-like isoform X2 [Dicentrarchus labrax]
METFKKKSVPHITIQPRGVTPTPERCTSCCSSVHCPLCRPQIFKPTIWSKVHKHLKGHAKRAVQHKDYTIFKCNLECKPTAHFHCPSCKQLLERRDRFVDHLGQCVQQAVEEEQEAKEEEEQQQQEAKEEEEEEQQHQQEAKGEEQEVNTSNLDASAEPGKGRTTSTSRRAEESLSVAFQDAPETATSHPQPQPTDDHGYALPASSPTALKTRLNEALGRVESLEREKKNAMGREKRAKSDVNAHLPGPLLPLSSLHLLVPPLRLMSACMWQVAQERNVDQYAKLAEFITLVTEMVPELLNYKQKTQLVLGLRAQLVLELLRRTDKVDCKAIWDNLNSFQPRTTNCIHEEDQDAEVEISKSAFVELVETLLRDQSEKDNFFKEVFLVQYGARFDTALQILVWEFFYRLEEFLPVPSFSQVFSMFDISSFDYEFEQFVSDPEDLKRILQHQQEHQHLTQSEFTFMSDTILSTLASKLTSAAPEEHIDPKMDEGGEDSKEKTEQKTLKLKDIYEDDEETDNGSIETNPNSGWLSPLTSSPCSEEAGDEAGEVTFQPPRCSVEGLKEHLDLSRSKEPSEESQSLTRGRDDASEDSVRTNKNTCLECGKTFACRSSLKRHHVVHSSVRSFKCTQCDKSYKSQKDLNRHFLTHSKPIVMSFACSLCEKRFSSRTLLTIHLRRHSGERPFVCSYCDKRFLTNSVLKSHVRIHTGERPYGCTFCDKKFTQVYPRTVHLRMHTKEKPYLCSTCGLSFCSSGALLVHSRTHTRERPHQCESCEKSFATAVQLKVHRRFHTGERPYSCSQCNKSFHSSSGLKKHTRTHTGEKPYQCLTCHKTFSQKSNMKIHLKVHKNF